MGGFSQSKFGKAFLLAQASLYSLGLQANAHMFHLVCYLWTQTPLAENLHSSILLICGHSEPAAFVFSPVLRPQKMNAMHASQCTITLKVR